MGQKCLSSLFNHNTGPGQIKIKVILTVFNSEFTLVLHLQHFSNNNNHIKTSRKLKPQSKKKYFKILSYIDRLH